MGNLQSKSRPRVIKQSITNQFLKQTIPVGTEDAAGAAQSRVGVVKQDDIVTHIEVTCACGRKTQIECHYE